MAFCRFSSLGFLCDLYCYESKDGFVTHVASMRVTSAISPVNFNLTDEALIADIQRRTIAMEASVRKPIGGPNDGESFCDLSLEDFRDRLTELKQAGYQFPEDIFETISEEIEQRDQVASVLTKNEP